MKRNTLPTLIMLQLLGLLAAARLQALPVYDGFGYPPGATLVGQTNPDGLVWAPAGPAGPNILIETGNLSVPGLSAPTGNRIRLQGVTAPSARLPVGATVTNGTIYFSFAFRVADLTGLGTNGGFFAGFNNAVGAQAGTPNVVGARVLTRLTEDGGGWTAGLSKGASGSSPEVWGPAVFTTNDTVFIVGSYTFNGGAANDDTARLWINPPPGSFGAASPPAPSLASSTGPDLDQLMSFVFFQRASGVQPAAALADELRIGGTWAVVTPPPPPANLAANVTASPSPATDGDPVVISVTVTNQGPGDAISVSVTNMLPAGVSFLGSTPPGTVGGPGNDTVLIALGNLPAGATATATVTGLVSNVQFGSAEGVTVTNKTSVGAANLVAPVVIVVPVPLFVQRDFGDAPDPTFPTLLFNNGARHRKVAGFHLGATIDRESNGQPTALADGDDLAGTDDEDGVNMGAMVPGLMATVNIAASAAGFVDAWIDFNRDGDWNDAGEHIFNALPVAAGVFGYNFPVPPPAVAGNAVARFRFSDVGGLAYTGYYQKGEVEDYGSFAISPVADLAAAVAVNPSPATEGDTVVFAITVTNRGASTATGVTVTNKLPAGLTGGQDGEQVIALGNLAPGATATATVTGLVSAVSFGNAEGVTVTNKTSVGAANLVAPVVIVVPVPLFVQRDFGDAPDPTFPTLLFNNGARHRKVAGFHLGATIDRESNGQPTALADGDDLAGTDDEDGVNMGAMVPGLMATVNIAASAAGFVDAWIDFNRDGDWNDAGEHIFNALPVAAGVFGYNFPVPPPAVAGNAVARFRFSDVGGLAYTGYYQKGEVEDYGSFAISPVADLAAAVAVNPSPATEGDTVVFAITVTNRGASTATGVTVTNKLPAGITGGQAGEQVIALGNLAPGATATATFIGLVSNVQFGNAEDVTVTNKTSVGAGNLLAPEVIFMPVPVFVQRDFGDALDPTYPTLFFNNGARHRKVAGFHLGATIDREPNGQPNLNATGDDNDGTDDEDGVSISGLVPGFMGTATIDASAAGFVDAWIDFNRDGNWNDPVEHIFNALPVAAGVFGYNFQVPPFAGGVAQSENAVTFAYARFRFSDVGGLAYTGYYQKGEVEDYLVVIVSPPKLYVRLLTNSLLELRWYACTNYAYQVESTVNFLQWQAASSPLAAPPGGGWLTNVVSATNAYQFFRLQVLPLTNSPVPCVPGGYSLYLTHGGIPRHYRLNIPAGYTNTVPAPLALILHGHNQTADSFAGQHPALATYASERGVILVLPDSTSNARGTSWNDGEVTPENPVDDVSFLLALIEQLDAKLNIDRKRVYTGGFSNGGQMCHWLASHTTNVFAALAAVASGIAGERDTPGVLFTNPPPSGPLPALIVNATNDCVRPFWGGTNADGRLQAAAFASAAHYTNANLCASLSALHTDYFVTNNGAISRFEPCVPNGLGQMALVTNLVIREHYQTTCAPGTEVLFVTLTDGGHQWPNAGDNVGFDANHEVLDFFLTHCNCNATGAVETLVVPTGPGQYDLRLCDQGYSRIFRLAIPAGYNPMMPAPTPIVFTFHGGNGTMASFSAEHPALFTKCDIEGVILVVPQATVHPRNGETSWSNKPFDYVVDDRFFITNLLEHIGAALNVNRKRVYACGFSNGGGFTHYLGSTTINLLAAIGPVCASTGWNDPVTGVILPTPSPLEPMPVLMVRGTLDSSRPFNGGPNFAGVLCRSAADDTAYWTSADSCIGGPVVSSVLNVTTYHYPACVGTTEVILVAVGGMDHLWPDAADGFNFDANEEVIDFLLRHARP